MQPTFKPNINAAIYIKDPESSTLGKKILSGSIDMIAEMGFEAFTFKKLAEHIDSTEASIYRYFESKHKLLLYLMNWYWGALNHKILVETEGIHNPDEKLKKILQILSQDVEGKGEIPFINDENLFTIIINEGPESYLTHQVDQENNEGDFAAFKVLVNEISNVVLEYNPEYKFSKMLISSVIESVHNQKYFRIHLPKLTDYTEDNTLYEFLSDMLFKTLKSYKWV